MVIPVWAVAAAVVLRAKKPLHYNEITDAILRSSLTDLARKGKTLEQTVGVILRETERNGNFVFRMEGGGLLRRPSAKADRKRSRSSEGDAIFEVGSSGHAASELLR